MRKFLPLFLVGIILPSLLSSCWWNKNTDEKELPPLDKQVILGGTLEKYNSGNIDEIHTTLNSEQFDESDTLLQDTLKKAIADNNTEDIIKILLFQLQNTLNQWNYEYAEAEWRDKAQQIIATIIGYDASYANHPQILAFQWYAEEINKNYTGAQLLYEQAYDETANFTSTNQFKAQLLNQMWHLEGLLGNIDRGYEYTYLAYELDPTNYAISLNIARYLAMTDRVSLSIPYFEYALNIQSTPVRSEIYFTLSSLMANKWSDAYNLDKAIEYAQLSIENNPNYPMWYYALAQAYYMMNDSIHKQIIEENLNKSIELNPNGYNSYELLGLLKFDNGNFDGAVTDIKKAIEVIPKDMLLMENQRSYNSTRLYMLVLLLDHIESGSPIDEQFKTVFMTEEYAVDNLAIQLDRPNNWFLKDSGNTIKSYFNN